MVRRKKRLLSAFAAVLMLVSLFTCFVLPVTAAEPVVNPISEFTESSPASAKWSVSSVEDLEKLSEVKGQTSILNRSSVVYITEDIDLSEYTGTKATDLTGLYAKLNGDLDGDGVGVTISGLTLSGKAWLGDYKGTEIKNLNFENCSNTESTGVSGLLIDVYESNGLTVENVSFKGCDNKTTSTTGRTSLVIGQVKKGNVTFKNIDIQGSTLKTGAANNAFLVGEVAVTAATTITVDKVYLNGNKFENSTGNTSALISNLTAAAVGKTTLSFKNIGIFNTTFNGKNRNGALCGVKGVTVAAVENVMVAGFSSGSFTGMFHSGTTATATNCYSAIPVVNGGTANGTEAAIASGEAAWTLNAAGVSQKWALDADGKIVFAKANDKLPYKVTLSAVALDDSGSTFGAVCYTDKTGKLIMDESLREKAIVWDGESLLTRVFDGDTAVEGKLLTEHSHDYQDYQYDDETDQHLQSCNYTDGDYRCPVTTEAADCSFEWNAPDLPPENALIHRKVCTVCGNTDEEGFCTLEETEDGVQCGIPGSIIYTCDICDYRYVESINREHKWTWVSDEENPGKHLRDCKWEDCSTSESADCDWNLVTVEPTRDGEGSETRTCELCGYRDVVVLPKISYIELVKKPVVFAGETMEVWVKLVNNPELSGMTIELEYDTSVFQIEEISKGSLMESLGEEEVLFTSRYDAGEAIINFAVRYGTVTEDGVIAVLKFKVADDAAVKDYDIKVTNVASDFNTNEVTVESDTETVVVRDFVRGDLNDDRFTDIADAVLLLRYIREKQDQTEMDIPDAGVHVTDVMADLNGNDEVNIQDVVYLLQYINGWHTDAEFYKL